jgi:hypothetical protein
MTEKVKREKVLTSGMTDRIGRENARGSGQNRLPTEGAGTLQRIRQGEGARSRRGSKSFFGRKKPKKMLFITSGDREDSEPAVRNRGGSFTEDA